MARSEAEQAHIDRIRDASEKGYKSFAEFSKDVLDWDKLDDLHKELVFSLAHSIVTDPHAKPWAAVMPANSHRGPLRSLDGAIREALDHAGYRYVD